MEELKQAAVAYYNNSTIEIQQKAWEFFKSIDTNGDGRISFGEFTQFLHCNGYNCFDPNFFRHLDTNGDQCLDFWEILTFYYLIKTRFSSCQRCRCMLNTLYFTCVDCFDGGQAFDLCSICYSTRHFSHHHNRFLDSYVLLRSKIGVSPGEDLNQGREFSYFWGRFFCLSLDRSALLNWSSSL
ncbi:hypothetical protein UlMin_010082 [Ulmus minor]